MKKIISLFLALLMLLSLFALPVYAGDVLADTDIQRIYKIMGVSTWGSGYFGCHMMNTEGDPVPDSVAHQYIQSAGLLKEYEYEKEVTADWGTYTEFGYELPYVRYMEIIDNAFANHSDMLTFLNGNENDYYKYDYYDETTGMVKWPSGGFGGPTDWIVQDIYRQSDSLIYATGLMVDYGYAPSDFDGLSENKDFIYVDENKAMIEDRILLTLKNEDGKWKILEYRQNDYYIINDVLYDTLEEKQYNRLTVEKTGAVTEETGKYEQYTWGFYGNGSKWYSEGDRLTFRITPRKGYALKKVVLKDKNGETEIKEADGVYEILPAGPATLSVVTEKIPVEIVLTKPEAAEVIKVSESKTEVYTVVNQTVNDVAAAISDDVEILNADGTKAENTDKLASGMKLVIKDEDGAVIDTKTVVVPGDVDGDAAISANDARDTLRAAVGLQPLDGWSEDAADVDGGSNIDSADARDILRAAVGLDNSAEWISKLA